MKTENKNKIGIKKSESNPITIWNGDRIEDAEVEYNVHYSDGRYHNTFSSKESAVEVAARVNGYVRIVIVANLIS